jgi:hypothetical protein
MAGAASTPLAAGPGHPLEDPPVEVRVSKVTPEPGRIQYRYTVVNGSKFPITALLVGYDDYWRLPRLKLPPVGWKGGEVPSTSFLAPPGWNFVVQPSKEDSLISVKWEISEKGGVIRGGESAGGFAVLVDGADHAYENGVWTVRMGAGDQSAFSGALVRSGFPARPYPSPHK